MVLSPSLVIIGLMRCYRVCEGIQWCVRVWVRAGVAWREWESEEGKNREGFSEGVIPEKVLQKRCSNKMHFSTSVSFGFKTLYVVVFVFTRGTLLRGTWREFVVARALKAGKP